MYIALYLSHSQLLLVCRYVISDDSGNSYDFNPCYGLSESTCTDTVVSWMWELPWIIHRMKYNWKWEREREREGIRDAEGAKLFGVLFWAACLYYFALYIFVSRLARQLEMVYNMAVVKSVLENFFMMRAVVLHLWNIQEDRMGGQLSLTL